MPFRIFTICAVMGGFAFGFSEIVSHAHHNAPAEPMTVACQDWTGQGCNPLLDQ